MVPHLTRAVHRYYHPVHVTARVVAAAPWLRSERVFKLLRALFARASQSGFRLLQHSVQGTHLHLIVEADDTISLARGMQRLLSRAAMMINALAHRSGQLWRDRHYREELTTPSQMRNALVYVLFNDRKHSQEPGVGFDMLSSALWFDGYVAADAPSKELLERAGPTVTVPPWTWLARKGWRRRGGAIALGEMPRPYRMRKRAARA